VIYFIKRPNDGRIKIGTSVRLVDRLKQLACEFGEGLAVLAVVDGHKDEERSLHRRFAHLRVVGEWFEPGDELLGLITTEGREWDGNNETSAIDIRLLIDGDLYRRIQAVADREGNSVAAYIRAALSRDLKRRKISEEGR
jgi:hypothetical protein